MRGGWQSLVAHPTEPKTALLIGSTKLFKTVDGGKHWRLLSESSSRLPQIIKLSFDKQKTDTLLALTSVGLFRSEDGGVQWVSLNKNLPQEVQNKLNAQFHKSDLVISSINSGAIYLSFQEEGFFSGTGQKPISSIYKSEDWGDSWQLLQAQFKANNVLLSPESGVLFVSNDEGVFELK
jgi:photosystem II stability/assembly factor-like uncharacterized protein